MYEWEYLHSTEFTFIKVCFVKIHSISKLVRQKPLRLSSKIVLNPYLGGYKYYVSRRISWDSVFMEECITRASAVP